MQKKRDEGQTAQYKFLRAPGPTPLDNDNPPYISCNKYLAEKNTTYERTRYKMDSVEQLKLLKMNEACRNAFYANFTPGSSFTKDQLQDYTAEEREWIEELVRDVLWSSMERRSAISTIGPEVEELLGESEKALPLTDTFLLEECIPEELQAVQEGVWAQVVRLVSEKNITNGVEIVELYDQINQPYFRCSWLDACRARSKCGKLKPIEEEGPDIVILQE